MVGARNCLPTEEVSMRKIAVQVYMSIDGVMEAPETWSFPYWTDDHEKYAYELKHLMLPPTNKLIHFFGQASTAWRNSLLFS